VKGLDEGVVKDEEYGRYVVGDLRATKEHLADVAYVTDFGVLEAESP
jgi:hypothetical protein